MEHEQRKQESGWIRNGGLFAKYVIYLVGLVLVVLIINGAIEAWFIYRETKSTLITAMAEKADATARRIEQYLSDTERQISWVTRASAGSLDQRRSDYVKLIGQVPAVNQLYYLDGSGHEQLRVTHTTVSVGSNVDFSRALDFSETVDKGIGWGKAFFRNDEPYMTISVAHSGRDAGITVAEVSLRVFSDFVRTAQAGKIGNGYVIGPKGELLATTDSNRSLGTNMSHLPQVAEALRGIESASTGTGIDGGGVLTASKLIPDLKWYVFFEQPVSQARLPLYNLLLRNAALVALGLIVAMLAGSFLARHMLVPIRALQTGARRLGAGDFGQRIDVKTSDELEELANQFNFMATELHGSYSQLEQKVTERTRDLAQSVAELKVLEEVGRAVVSSLDLEAVLPTIASRASEITGADAVLIFSATASSRSFALVQAIGITPPRPDGQPLTIDGEGNALGRAADSGQSLEIADLDAEGSYPMRDAALAAGFHSVLIVPLLDQQGILGALVILRKAPGHFPTNVIGLMQTFAHQAVLAMRNARLFTEVDHKGRELAIAHETVQHQATKLQEQTDQLRDWNKSLEERVAAQLAEIGRISRLERFLAPQVAQIIASSDGHDALLASHRGEVTVVFCDLRGFTSFTESTEPEELMNVLREYHSTLGELIFKYEGTLDRFAGDGVMVLFNAPIPLPDHAKRAVRMAVEMRDNVGKLVQRWRNRGHSLGFGVGIAVGYATLGQIGFEQRLEYAAIGGVTNLASRLCDEAKAGQIIASQRTYGMVQEFFDAVPIEDLTLKGFNRPIAAVEILRWKETDEATPAPPAAASAGRKG
jgi:class 3 adenylate cyclase/HAMP domain-containing protein